MAEPYQAEIYQVLKISDVPIHKAPVKQQAVAQTATLTKKGIPLDLPVVDFSQVWDQSMADQVAEAILGRDPEPTGTTLPFSEIIAKPTSQIVSKTRSWFKGLVFYPVIFVISFAFFYVLLNFSSLVSQVNAWFIKPEAEQILQTDLNPFYDWMGGYFFAVQDKELLDPNNDIDKDGLSNLDEYITRTNPTIADSDVDGISDGLEVMNSTNFWGSGAMTTAQKKLREQLDIIKINNRVSYNAVSITEHINAEPVIEYDLEKPGILSIPKLNMQVPLIWSKDPNDFEVDLTHGVVHYPGTALPGEKGTVYISGHSSDYLWKNHSYKTVFARINALEKGDDIFVDIYGKDGKTYNYRYQVTEENIFKPDDQTQFIDNTHAKLNLSTCWPIGTQRDRYVVSSTLVSL